MAFSPGTRLGPYEVRSFLSAGGMGEVYVAYDPRLGRQVAIKVLTRPLAELPEFRERFEREIQTISRLNHKNICTIFDTGTYEGRPYIVMELLEGKNLEELLESGAMDVEKVLHVGIQVAAALDAAHRSGVIHRDVKSANVFLNDRGDAKVLDFGIAKVVADADAAAQEKSSSVTRSDAIMGTVAFMSPEQARGDDVDARSDLFSLGVVLYGMATGQTPFRGTPTSIVAQLVSPQPVPNARSVQPDIPDELDRILSRALEKDREMRYQTAADLLAALRALRRDLSVGGTGPRAASPGVPGPDHRPSWTTRILQVSGVVATTVLLGLLGWRALHPVALGDRPIHSMAVLPCANRPNDASTEYFCALLGERIRISLSQVPGLTVLGSQAVEPYLGDARGAIKVGEDLGVDAVLTADVRKQADALSVIVEVTDVRNGVHVWGDLFPSSTAEAQEMPQKIALDVAENLQVRLSATDKARLQVVQTYQQAQYYWNDRTATSLRRAIDLFTQVIQADSTFAKAYVGLASAYTLLHYYGDLSPGESYPRARAAAEQALRLDESLADAHANLGLVKRDYDRDWQGAEREFQRALQLDPTSADALQWYAELLTMTGRFDEAEARIAQAEKASPLSLTIRAVHGWILTAAGRYAEAHKQFDNTIEMDQDFALTHWFLGQLDFAEKNYPAAIKAFEAAIAGDTRPSRRVADLAAAYAFSGDRDQAMTLLHELQQRQRSGEYVSGYSLAIVLAGLGQRDQAFKALEGALEERTWEVANMAIDPMLEPLHSDPRFNQLLIRAGLLAS